MAASIVFKDRKGQIIKVGKIAQGTEFVAEVTIKNQRNERVENVHCRRFYPRV
jgi:hypothetical protein